jgi:hypothetical protein
VGTLDYFQLDCFVCDVTKALALHFVLTEESHQLEQTLIAIALR